MQITRTQETHTHNGQHHLSAIAEHIHLNPGHNINFEKTQVIAKTQKYLPRIIKEAIEIQKHPNNFNRDDSYKLSFTWKQLIKNNRTA